MELNKIYNESCLEGIEKIDFPVNLVITSPPYNVNLGNNKLYKQKYDVYHLDLQGTSQDQVSAILQMNQQHRLCDLQCHMQQGRLA